MLIGERDGLRPAVCAELLEEPLCVGTDGLGTDEEPACDLDLAETVREELENFQLSFGELDAGVAVGMPAPALQVPADASDEVVEREGLHEVIVAADEEARDPVEGHCSLPRDEDDRQPVAELLPEGATDLHAAGARQVDVEHDEHW